jgi:hypothetical protein
LGGDISDSILGMVGRIVSDNPVENSREHVAYRLLQEIARAEKKIITGLVHNSPSGETTRKWLLDTYAECLDAVKAQRTYPKPKD